ncbi:cytochrome P450 [Xylariaceae sp. AK1471]|nr:cytochrome P450 [Xylariaceae sp. AK1471]
MNSTAEDRHYWAKVLAIHLSPYTNNPIALLLLLPLVSTVIWYVVGYVQSPLKKYPGPPLAAWTNYWRMYHAYWGSIHLVSKKMHDRYGPVVRMAPNYLDVDYSSLIKTCFDRNGVWKKSELYAVSGVLHNGQITYNIFSEIDTAAFTRMKKPIAKHFSMNGVLPFQTHIDDVLAHFVRKIDEKYGGTGNGATESFDFGKWMLYLTWDMVGKATFGARIGYLDHGCDFDGTLEKSEKALDYIVTIGVQPKLDNLLDKNRLYRIGPPTMLSLVNLSVQHVMRRYTGEDKHDPGKPDFLDRYIEAKAENPDVVDDARLLSYLLVNMAAGADTTAVTLRTIFYLCLKHPMVWARLQDEIFKAPFAQRDTMDLPASFAQARALPYLEAVVRESLRLWPGNCFPMERYVPTGGITLPDGSFVPEGVLLGFNAWVMHRNKSVWGPDAEAFRPERWLRDEAGSESEEEYKNRLKDMNNNDLSFGGGLRKCIGQNLGLLKVYKTVATLVALYEFELANPDKEWTIHNSIFPRQSGIEMRMKRRPGMEIREGVGLDE